MWALQYFEKITIPCDEDGLDWTAANFFYTLSHLSTQFPRYTRRGQKVLATMLFLFTWVLLYKDGGVCIKYKPLSVIPPNMDSIARLVALQH